MASEYCLTKKNLKQSKMKVLLMTRQSKWVFERLWQIDRALKATYINKALCVPGKDQIMPPTAHFSTMARFYYTRK